MKLNKNKIIVSALALAIGGSLAGSVGSTIAWYQYSTRANVSYVGEASGVSSNLQMRFVSEASDPTAWRTRITWQEMNAELGQDMHIVPMTFGALGKDAALPAKGYVQPAPGVADMTKWDEATDRNYAQFKLQIRNVDRNGAQAQNNAEDIFLSQLVLQKDLKNPEGKEDISDALRVHIKADDGINTPLNRLISKNGKDINTSGKLDIDGDSKDDKAYPADDEFGFGYDGENRHVLSDVIYGDEDGDGTLNEIQSSYANTYDPEFGGVKFTQEEIDAAQDGDPAYGKTTDDWKVEPANPALVYSENNVLYDDDSKADEPAAGKAIGKTLANESAYLSVTITVWVEGWQKFNGNAIWDATKYIDSKFNVGIQFAVQDRR